MPKLPRFTDIILLPATCYRSQEHTSSCWAFSVISFLESELINSDNNRRFSPWYIARNRITDQFDIITDKKETGKAKIQNIPRGGIGNTALHLIAKYGVIDDSADGSQGKFMYLYEDFVRLKTVSVLL